MNAPLLEVADLVVDYALRAAPWRLRSGGRVRALEGVSFALDPGETLALAGRSGSGKSSVARALLGLVRPTSGRMLYRRSEKEPVDLLALPPRARRVVQRELGLVFQDPNQSLNPRLPVGEAVAEPVRVLGERSPSEARARAARLFARVGLAPAALDRFPHEFSGGERQRIAIARALALAPRLVVLDEAVSALDAAIRAQILELLHELQSELGLAYLFITHDLALARIVAERVVVLDEGRVAESGPVGDVLDRPRHPATQRLVNAMLSGDPRRPTLARRARNA